MAKAPADLPRTLADGLVAELINGVGWDSVIGTDLADVGLPPLAGQMLGAPPFMVLLLAGCGL